MKSDQAEIPLPRSSGTIASATYERVRADIIAARLAPGAKLRIREICKHYEVSLSPMREALNRLSAEQLVVLNDQRGFAVSSVSKERLTELTLSRVWLNELALRHSIKNGGQEWEEQLLLSFHRLSRVPRYAETETLGLNPAWTQPHRAFHSALIAACPSDWIKLYCEQLFDQADRYRNLSRSIVMRNRGDIDEHRPLMEVAIARETDRAVQLLTQHMTRTTDILLDNWDDISKTQYEAS
jgi:GntR family carbon starvation induced transcriptional regulator